MVNALVSGASGPGHCVVCLGIKTLLTVPLSTQEYKWVPAHCWENLINCLGPAMD